MSSKLQKMRILLSPRTFKKGLRYMKKNGLKGFYIRLRRILTGMDSNYNTWRENHIPTEEELDNQRKTKFSYAPKISVLVPTYNTPKKFLVEMIESVTNQTYSNWQLCIADGSEGNKEVEEILEQYAQKDSRIKYNVLSKNLGIAGNTNGAWDLADGEYMALFDHDDLLTPDALFHVVDALQEEAYDIIYTDEDKVSSNLKKYFDPHFKPDFSIDLFRVHNYITHLFIAKKEVFDKAGRFDSKYDGAQDYDIMFRCIENAKTIKHIHRILYHWRTHKDSTAGNPESKMYAYEAGRLALEDHLKRVEVKAKVEHTNHWAMYNVTYETPGNPLISIIIPNKDHIKDLDKCIKSIINKSTYTNYEFIIVENNSENKETFEYYEEISNKNDNIKVVNWEKGFNYAAINNFGVTNAKGDYYLFLNNDTELISPNGLQEMLGICMRNEVGIVGARLYFEDNTIQHMGIVLGFGGFAGHVFSGARKDDLCYMLRNQVNSNFSAVTAACMLVKKSVFDEIEGFSEEFVVALNDVDFCLKARGKEYLIVCAANSEWYHYESKSRGYEDTPEKKARFDGEVALFQTKWKDVLTQGDPYYNDNFPTTIAPFTLPE